jgi:hypothetical protein
MVDNRLYRPRECQSLRSLIAGQGRSSPVIVKRGIQIEFSPEVPEGWLVRNFPDRSYSVREGISLDDLVEILAWEGAEWEAIEIARFWRKRVS